MSFNGSGVFQRLYSFVNDAAANIKIRADRMDNELSGMATGLSTCITKDGQTTITANLPMANFRHTGVGAGAARTDYTRLDQSQDGKLAWVDGGGTADAITASYAIPLTTLVDGQLCYVRATAANATTTPTFSPSALTARTIVKNGGSALAAGDISGDGHELILRYDLANTRWELLNPKAPTIAASLTDLSTKWTPASASGSASLQFPEDTDNGTNKVTLSPAASLTADRAITFPDAAGEIVLDTATQTLTNKSLTDPLISAGGGALILPQSSSPTPTTEGDIRWDTDDNRLVVGDGAGQQTFYPMVLAYGTYTPTLTNVANISASTAYACQYMRVGNMVTVSGKVDVDVTTAGTGTTLGISLPIASNFTATQQLGGAGFATSITAAAGGAGAGLLADTANDRASMTWGCGTDTANREFTLNFSYQVL